MAHPDVLLCAVVAKPDEKWGEVPCAFVELKDGVTGDEADLIAFAREKLAGFKTPKTGGVSGIAQDLDRQDPEIRAARDCQGIVRKAKPRARRPTTAPQAARSPTRGVAKQRSFGSLYPRPVIEPQFYAQRLQNRPLPPRPKPRARRPAGWRYNDIQVTLSPPVLQPQSMHNGCKSTPPTAPSRALADPRGGEQRQFRSLYGRPVIEPQFYAQRLQNRRPRGRVGDRAAALRALIPRGGHINGQEKIPSVRFRISLIENMHMASLPCGSFPMFLSHAIRL